jgi:zinc transporter ZupT
MSLVDSLLISLLYILTRFYDSSRITPGALFATGAFLLIPESLDLLVAGTASVSAAAHHNRELVITTIHKEGASAWRFGASLLGGFLAPLLLHTFLPQAQDIVENCEDCAAAEEEEDVMMSPAARELIAGDEDDDDDEEDEDADKMDKQAADLRTMESGCDAHECKHATHQGAAAEADGDEELADEDVQESALARSSSNKPTTTLTTTPHQSNNNTSATMPLMLSILIGDGIHNFTDGVFLANAFLLCSRDIAWTIVATTIYHELAQELADYIVLTTHCGLPIWKALTYNFISGLSCLLGAVVILIADLSKETTGSILAVSAGVYLYITAVECVPRVLEQAKESRKLFLIFVGMFTLGAVPIGLVLLNHGHCGSG